MSNEQGRKERWYTYGWIGASRDAHNAEPATADTNQKHHAAKRALRCAWRIVSFPFRLIGGLVRHTVECLSVDTWEAIFSFFVVLFTAVLTYTSVKQWTLMDDALRETRTSNEIAREAMEVDSRPWVLLDWIEGDPTVDAEIRFFLKNGGKTPAIYMYVDANLVSAPGELPDPPPTFPEDPRKQRALSVVGPEQRLTERITVELKDRTDSAKVADIAAGKLNSYVYGYALYWDQFGVERGLTFCQRFKPSTKRWAFCSSFNVPW